VNYLAKKAVEQTMKNLFACMLTTAGLALGQTPSGIPVVVELFTSEGCSSCPPADRLLGILDREQPVQGVQVIVLSEHVDYWNTSGWVDPFSAHAFTERQQRYGQALHIEEVYTPQAVIDGRLEVVGNSAPKLEGAIQRAMQDKKVPLQLRVQQTERGIHVELNGPEGLPHGAEVYFAIAEDSVETKVSAGENSGRVLAHTAVVRSLTKARKLAAAGESGITMDLKANAHWGNHLRVVALLTEHDGGKILGAAIAEL
jgi:hypothetical protein